MQYLIKQFMHSSWVQGSLHCTEIFLAQTNAFNKMRRYVLGPFYQHKLFKI